MDIFTFGIVATGLFGGSLVFISLLENAGLVINHSMVKVVLEFAKYGSIIYLLKELTKFI
ncbi:hypothetical protein NST81_03040 [Bacillus sp. FSL W8-0223]|uniref:hypothetical protein n=1 Tax=Bacillus sp. FSL W8-0223 TaxID=2954595 RepID=UPI0030FB8929